MLKSAVLCQYITAAIGSIIVLIASSKALPMVNLADNIERKRLVMQMQKDLDAFCKAEFAEDARTHLGASIIGHDCKAYGWNTFRWLSFEDFSGRMYRLFNRGHEEERRFVRWLEGIGFEVREVDPETGNQFRIVGCKGHFGGSLDSMMKPPAKYNLSDDLIWLGEFKTHNEKSYAKLAGAKPAWKDMDTKGRSGGKGVIMAKPQHYRQMCSYGRAYGFKFGLYCAVNKETDELYFEIVELDWRQADDLFRKAESIVFSQSQPPKIAQSEAFSDCRICDFSDICHKGKPPTKNCRSCVNAIPVDNAEWLCQLYGNIIPKEFIPKGCDSWKAIINGGA